MLGYLSDSLASRALTYGYANARVKAMHAQLLSAKDFDTLVGAKDLNAITSFLDRTDYKADLVSTSLQHKGADRVELALGLNYARTVAKLLGIAPKAALPVLTAILRKWDVHNLKALLLAKHEKKSAAEIEPYLVNCGNLSETKRKKLLEQEKVEGLLNLLGDTEYGSVLERAQKRFEATQDVNTLLEALDLHYYSGLSAQIRGTYKDERLIQQLVEAEVDAKNLLNALRLRKEGKDDAAIIAVFIEGGRLNRTRMQGLLKAKGFESLLTAACEWLGLPPAEQTGKSLAQLETRLAHRLAEQSLHALRRSILSLGSLVGFLYLKENEVGNMRKIVRAKEYNLSEKTTRDMLVLPS